MNEKDKKKLIEAVKFTIIYYNVSDYPPTTFEIWKHLVNYGKIQTGKCRLLEIIQTLESDKIKKEFLCQDSFWVLRGYEKLIRNRVKKQKVTVAKIRKLKKWVKLASFLPYLRGVFINGTLAMERANVLSDWDVLLVMKKDRIWIGRFLISVFFQLFFKRRHHDKIKDRFCLNHFLAEDGLILEENGIYSANELVFTMPIIGEDVFRKFIQLNEFQVKRFKPNYEKDAISGFFTIKDQSILEKIKKVLELVLDATFLGNLLNLVSRSIMIRKIKNNPKTYMEGADIRYNDQALVFLPQPRRGIILERATALFRSKVKQNTVT